MMLIPAVYYQTIYLVIVTLMTLVAYSQYQRRNGLREFKHTTTDVLAGALVLFMVFFIGMRPVDKIFADMVNYANWYAYYYEGELFNFNRETDNLLFDNLFAWWGSERLGYTSFFVCIAAIYFGAAYLGIRKLFPNHRLTAYLVFLAAFSTFSFSTNGIKAGAATSLFILAMGYRENLKICIPLILVSWGFHHSMIMPVVAFILTLIYKNSKVYFAAWCLCLLIAVFHITFFQELFADILSESDESGANYLYSSGLDWGGITGFRIDFVIYSSMPILVGYWAVYKKRLQLSKIYTCLLNLYMTLNGTWMLCMYANFTNRIAYLSWFLYPIVLIYPYLNENWGPRRYKDFSMVMLAHLGFTLFMKFIYYS